MAILEQSKTYIDGVDIVKGQDITDTQDTAINANNNATTALDTANSASSDAQSALEKANTAISTANTVSSTAQTALNTANTANSNATTAQTTANTANTKAENAQTTANGALQRSGGTMSGALVLTGGDAVSGVGNMQLDTNGQITAKGTTSTLFGRNSATNLLVGHSSHSLTMRGSATRPTYNGTNMALYSDIPTFTYDESTKTLNIVTGG